MSLILTVITPLAAVLATGAPGSTSSTQPASATDHVVWQRSAGQVVIWDARPELGIGSHGLSQEHINLIKQLGIRLVRVTLYWNRIESGKAGQCDAERLKAFDELVARAKANGIALLLVVHAPPGELDRYERRAEAYARFSCFVGAMVRRYPSVLYWELFNEMDVAFTKIFGAQQKDVPMRRRGHLYAEMLKQAYPVIKAANPKAWVLTGGMSDFREFPEGIYEAGGRAFFDIMNLHTYGVPVLWSFVERGRILREIMRAHGDVDKPLWNTEFGIDAGNIVGAWGYPHAQTPAKDDAATFDELHLEQWKACIEWNAKHRLYQKILPYQLHAHNERDDDGKIRQTARLPAGHTIDDYGFGILRRDGKIPRPTYEWLAKTRVNADILRAPTRRLSIEYVPRFTGTPAGGVRPKWHDLVRLPDLTLDSLVPTVLEMK